MISVITAPSGFSSHVTGDQSTQQTKAQFSLRLTETGYDTIPLKICLTANRTVYASSPGPLSPNFTAVIELQLLEDGSLSFAKLCHFHHFENTSFPSHGRELHMLHCWYSHETHPSVLTCICLHFISSTFAQTLSGSCREGG